ncbi:hypothetical protein BN2475_120224 [Paraburkholderia ribeironis]|uniref:Uncharacterized protein n=1 Tax=Paraburkholderia ribeironis TaxID=1247936 RepID=A0A1N7RRQ1_9BURK|nr:hypothetical protein BN2475_120224 [Paraburkholderia ribeironis]
MPHAQRDHRDDDRRDAPQPGAVLLSAAAERHRHPAARQILARRSGHRQIRRGHSRLAPQRLRERRGIGTKHLRVTAHHAERERRVRQMADVARFERAQLDDGHLETRRHVFDRPAFRFTQLGQARANRRQRIDARLGNGLDHRPRDWRRMAFVCICVVRLRVLRLTHPKSFRVDSFSLVQPGQIEASCPNRRPFITKCAASCAASDRFCKLSFQSTVA